MIGQADKPTDTNQVGGDFHQQLVTLTTLCLLMKIISTWWNDHSQSNYYDN